METTEPHRPDPDQLLHELKREEEESKRGKLKIFFGMCAGVGKTYEMLKAARQVLEQRVDIVVAYVETHRRKETMALVEGLEILPRKTMTYRTTTLEEMDLDAVLARKPRIALVDELAHTNAPGSRHPKRYQDVIELLDNGIDVYTTLNVQHLESRADTVAQITGIPVHETVPDSIFEMADEVELIDISEEVLLQRFAEGKVYTPDRAQAAVKNFFRKGNISALREMALRLTAERVDQELQDYRTLKAIPGIAKTRQRLLLGITADPDCERLIRLTRRLAYASKSSWVAVHIETAGASSVAVQERLMKHINLAKELGADVITTADRDVAAALVRVAHEQNARQIIVGRSFRSNIFPSHNIIDRLLALSTDIDIYVSSSHHETPRRRTHFILPRFTSEPRQYVAAFGAVVLAAVICYAFLSFLGYQTVALLLLMLISILPLFLGIGPVLLAATLSALVWDFFFIPPQFTFIIGKAADILMFVAYFVFASVTSILTSRIRLQERAVRQREERTTALYKLTKELSSERGQDDVLRVAVASLRSIFHAEIVVLLGEPDGDISPKPHPSSTFIIDEKELSVAVWSYWNEKKAGRHTDTLPNAQATYYPIKGSRYTLAVFGIKRSDSSPLSLEQENLLDNCIALISTAMDREFLNELTRRTSVVEESERLYQTLLSSISHELRTPIATIMGNADNLQSEKVRARSSVVDSLLAEIKTAAERLNRLVENLLDMTRVESGMFKVKLDWTDIHDLFASVLRNVARETKEHHVHINVMDTMPLVRLDFGLMEQVLVNLLFNAAAYTPKGSTISLEAEEQSGVCIITVSDNGPGLPSEALERVFEKFYRVPGTPSGGTGLGLSIAKSYVEAHKGTITASNRLSGGAQFTIRIPSEIKQMKLIETET